MDELSFLQQHLDQWPITFVIVGIILLVTDKEPVSRVDNGLEKSQDAKVTFRHNSIIVL